MIKKNKNEKTGLCRIIAGCLSRQCIHRLRLAALVSSLLTICACGHPREIAWDRYTQGLEQYNDAQWQECLKSFESSIRTGYSVPGVHADYAIALAREGRLDEALAQLQEEVRLHPKSLVLINHMIELIKKQEPESVQTEEEEKKEAQP